MIPANCRIKHDPENGTYGDCLRAGIASIMELNTEEVTHFYEDGCSGEEGNRRLSQWLRFRGYAPFFCNYDGDNSLNDMLAFMGKQNPDVWYLLYGMTATGDHVVVCRGAHVKHNPAWFGSPIIGPTSSGQWVVLVIAKA